MTLSCNTNRRKTQFNTDKFGDTREMIDSKIFNVNMTENKDRITIKVPDNFELTVQSLIDYNVLIDTIWYIPLETKKASLIQYIEKVKLNKEYIYVHDAISGVLLKFDNDGNFITKIGNKGGAPHEYSSIKYFEIVDNELLILDDRAAKIKYYDLNGNYIKDKKLAFRMNQFSSIDDSTFICDITARGNFHITEIEDFKLILCNTNWKIIGRADRYDANSESGLSFSRNVFTRSTDELIYNPSFSYIIFSFEEKKFTEKYFIDVGKRKLPLNFSQNLSTEDFMGKYMTKNSDFMYIFKPALETKNHLLLTLTYKMQNIPVYYSKATGRIISNRYSKLLPEFPLGIPDPHDIISDTFIGHINPDMAIHNFGLVKNDKSLVKSKIPEYIESMINKLKNDDNPILVFYKLKDF